MPQTLLWDIAEQYPQAICIEGNRRIMCVRHGSGELEQVAERLAERRRTEEMPQNLILSYLRL